MNVRPDQHATITGYRIGCRCAGCRQAWTDWYREHRRKQSTDMFGAVAPMSEVREWARSLGFSLPNRGRQHDALIARFNREHPERPYVQPSDRTP